MQTFSPATDLSTGVLHGQRQVGVLALARLGAKGLVQPGHRHFAKSWFRTGFDNLRNLLRNRDIKLVRTWPTHRKSWGVV